MTAAPVTISSPQKRQEEVFQATPSKRKPGRPLKQSTLLKKMALANNLNDLSTNAENNILRVSSAHKKK